MTEHTNYSKMYISEKQESFIEPNELLDEHEVVEVEPATVEEVQPAFVSGRVVDCAKLNVREQPDRTADVVCVLEKNTEVEIDTTVDNDGWYHICTAAGIEGYCMKEYIFVIK